MKNFIRISFPAALIVFFAFAFCSNFTAAQEANTGNLKESLYFLASDKLEGRMIGTEGNRLAAEYIKNYIQNLGLKPVNGSYYNEFSYAAAGTDANVGAASEMSFNTLLERIGLPKDQWKSIKKKMEFNSAWKVLPMSSSCDLTAIPVVFAGFGVTTADSVGYDDYSKIDVKGKAVIILSDSMFAGKSGYNFLDAHSDAMEKISNASRHGAAAVILVKRQSDSANTWYGTRNEQIPSTSFGIPVVQMNRTALDRFFPKSSLIIDLERKIDETHQPQSIELTPTLNLKIDIDVPTQKVNNVMGIIEGSDPLLKKKFIVIGAHFDHIGYGNGYSMYRGPEKLIHNGADDNASGSSTILELARMISKNPLKYSVLFLAFNGEEEGLLGSAAFIKNPPIPKSDMVAMFNFDMVGRLRDGKVDMSGTGSAAEFSALVDKYSKQYNLTISKMADGFDPSDISSFYGAGIPSLMFFTGLHGDYHAPGDDAEKINYDGMKTIIDFSYSIIKEIDNMDHQPKYIEVKADSSNRLQQMSHGGGGVRFGIIPDFSDNPDGCPISGVSDGTPAQKAGLLGGDVLTEFGGKPLKNLYDLTYSLRECKPGQKVIVKFLRGGKPMQTEVTLVANG